ncbi:MAG: helix-turn-helix transcriptional regulator, partial [Actinobacteria bacterium]|nr:helix-turn-helix transcriptional regulator [Actinomycetota bacterium]
MARTRLTDREDEVLRLVISGLSNDEIAGHLRISRRTVEAHMRTLFRKAGVVRRTQLAALYQGGELVTGSSGVGVADDPAPPVHQRRDLEQCERRLRGYAAAVRGLVDRQFPLFKEQVKITVMVGEQDGQDVVIERRWTTPRPYLVYRVLSPITGWPEVSFELDDLALACHVDGQDTQVEVHQIRDVDGLPLVMVLFQPGLQLDTEWVLQYRSPQLWNPLRESGWDTLTWATATLDQRHPPTTTDLTLNVVFPASWTGARITERSNLGSIRTERLPTGQAQVT